MDLLNACQHITKTDKDILSVILHGSRARGDYKEDSDYDIIFITKSPSKSLDEEFKIKQNYKNKLAERTKINEDKLQISLWPFNDFKKEYKKGNSFVHCALRDGKFLFSKCKINFNQPTSFYRYALDRITITKRNIDNIEFTLKNFKNSILGSIEREDLGYCSMHLCWAVCMFNNHLPISKYTVLKECKRYFTKKEFKSIKRTYQLYAKNNHKRIKNEIFSSLFNDLKRILKRIEKEYVRKEETN